MSHGDFSTSKTFHLMHLHVQSTGRSNVVAGRREFLDVTCSTEMFMTASPLLAIFLNEQSNSFSGAPPLALCAYSATEFLGAVWFLFSALGDSTQDAYHFRFPSGWATADCVLLCPGLWSVVCVSRSITDIEVVHVWARNTCPLAGTTHRRNVGLPCCGPDVKPSNMAHPTRHMDGKCAYLNPQTK
jgi:hypothetical protein